MKSVITTLAVFAVFATFVAYANAEGAPNSVEVTSFPFDLSVMEDGHITFNNLDGSAPMNFVAYGWFEGTVAVGEVLVIQLPTENCGNTCYIAEDYYIKDLNTGEHSILHILAPYVAPEPEPVQQPVQQQVQDPIYQVELVTVDDSEFQQQLVDLTNSLNSSLETIAMQREQIEGLESNVQSLTAQVIALNTTSVASDESVAKIFELEGQIETLQLNATSWSSERFSLEGQVNSANAELTSTQVELSSTQLELANMTSERDEWKTLAHSWYAVAMEQLRVMVEVLGL